jgi:hypothetical protein
LRHAQLLPLTVVYRACLVVHVLTISTMCLQFLQRLRLQLHLPVPVHLHPCAPSVHHHLGSLPVFLSLYFRAYMKPGKVYYLSICLFFEYPLMFLYLCLVRCFCKCLKIYYSYFSNKNMQTPVYLLSSPVKKPMFDAVYYLQFI